MLTYIFTKIISKFLARFIDNGRKTVLYISAFFIFIKITVFLFLFFKTGVVLNYYNLIYFNIS